MHFCQDELYALMMLIPGLGFFVSWIKAKLHHRKDHNACKKG